MSFKRTILLAALAALALARTAVAANVDGANVHWTSAGSGPNTVIFVHGWTCDESSWSAQVPALTGKYRVITLDLPGHGKSAAPAGGKFSMENFARAVEAVRAEAGVDHVVVVGHSMGTPVIREYQLLYPQHVAAMVVVAPWWIFHVMFSVVTFLHHTHPRVPWFRTKRESSYFAGQVQATVHAIEAEAILQCDLGIYVETEANDITEHASAEMDLFLRLLDIVPTTLAGVVALVTYLEQIRQKDPWKFEDNYATPLIGTLATAFNRMAVAS